jgi:hypothetical protein
MHLTGAFHPTKCAPRYWIPRRNPLTLTEMHLGWRWVCVGARHALDPSTALRARAGSVALRFMVLVMILVGCSADDNGPNVAHETPNPPPSERCRANTDCLVGTTCQPTTAFDQSEISLQNVAGAAALPCPTDCFDPVQCPQGMTCGTGNVGAFTCQQCVAGCKNHDCAAGSVCEANACQPVTSCDAPDFTGCPQYWTCDPEGALQPPSALRSQPDYETQWRAYAAGCRPLLCNEPDAQPCPQYSRCDDTAGSCIAIPCGELGSCPNGGVCREPGTDEGHDVYGCVPANCEEGFACQPGEVCDIENTHPSTRGCRAQLCTEGYDCLPTQTCRPGTISANNHGCVTPTQFCQSDAECSGQICVTNQCRTQFGVCR